MKPAVIKTSEAETALISLMNWAESNFDAAVADGVSALVRTGLTALREKTLEAIHAQAYAAELERQRDYISNQLMHAEASGRMTGLRETVEDTARALDITRAEAIAFVKTITGENAYILSDYYAEQAAELARDIAATLRREATPLSDALPALPDDFDDEDDL